jgi:para-nitrobenzyl esterase
MVRRVSLPVGSLLTEVEDGVVLARGVPYARAERFAAPGSIGPWVGELDARRRGPACPQLPSRLDAVTGPVVDGLVQSEDCLVATIAAPVDADDLPVMVWFHGGAYMSGSGEAPKYDPAVLAREGNVVVVNVTYRLGVLGYLPPTAAGSNNLGLLDQLAALEWIRTNISALGGDPERVTVFGQSAGGDSILALTVAPGGDRLFQRAIVQSAPIGLRAGRQPMFDALRQVIDERIGDSFTDSDLGQVFDAQSAAIDDAQQFGPIGGMPFGPALGRHPLPSEEEAPQLLTSAAATIDLLIGWTSLDAAPFVALAAGRSLREPLGDDLAELAAGVTEAIFASPAIELADAVRQQGGDVATYRFSAAPPRAPLGACHCIELPYLFGTDWSDAPMLGGVDPDPDLSAHLRQTWAEFAWTGTRGLPGTDISFETT